MAARRITLRVQPPAPFGDVALVPAALTGRPEGDVARAIAATLADVDVPTVADALKKYLPFPKTLLSTRHAALGVIMERLRQA